MTKEEKATIEATRNFASVNNIHYDKLTESMILNAMREILLTSVITYENDCKCTVEETTGATTQYVCNCCGRVNRDIDKF